MVETTEFDLETTLESFKTHLQYYGPAQDQRSERTADGYAREVERFAKYLEEHRLDTSGILDVTTSDLRQYLIYRRSEHNDKDRTIVGRRSALSQFYQVLKILAEDGEIPIHVDEVPENPEDKNNETWSVGKPHKSKKGWKPYLSPDDIQKLYRNSPAPEFRNTLIMKILYQSGIRRSELAFLRMSDIEPLDNQEITIRAENSKSGKERTVYYKESLISDLRRWVHGGYRNASAKDPNSEYLFPTRERDYINPDHLTQIVKRAAEQAGLQAYIYTDGGGKRREAITPHTLRHSFAVAMLRPPNNVDVRTLQNLLGHSDLETTEQYLDIVREDEKKEYKRVGGPPETVGE